MAYYWNGAGQCFHLPERQLEPDDCWDDSKYVPAEDPLDEISEKKTHADYYVKGECIGSRTIDPDMDEDEFEDACYNDAVWLHREQKEVVTIVYDDGTIDRV